MKKIQKEIQCDVCAKTLTIQAEPGECITDYAVAKGWYVKLVNPAPGEFFGIRCPKHLKAEEGPISALKGRTY